MQKRINLLDCTLRDGGYINNWKFGINTIKDIIIKLVNSNMDLIEAGFLRNCEYNINKTLFNNCKETENGKYVHCVEVISDSVSVDNLRDIAKVENIMQQRGIM